jgi:hypothetical protein
MYKGSWSMFKNIKDSSVQSSNFDFILPKLK